MLQFRESLVQSLFLGVPCENLKHDPRQQSTSHLKRKLADHKLEAKEGPVRVLEDIAPALTRKTENNNSETCVMQ